jgi:hypothetical protein
MAAGLMTSEPEVTSRLQNMADDVASGGHVMLTIMADDLIIPVWRLNPTLTSDM